MIVRILCFGVALFAGILQLTAATLILPAAQWRYQKGLAEASTPPTGSVKITSMVFND